MKTAAGNLFGLACLAISVLVIGACTRSYSSQLFTFPSEVKPHESGWTYLGTVTVWDKSGVAPQEPANKRMTVVIRDADGERLLDEHFEIHGGTFEHRIEWNEVRFLRIETWGTKPQSDKPLLVLNFEFDGADFTQIAP